MDDNPGWKFIYLGALFSLLVLGVAYYMMSPKDPAFYERNNVVKIAEFKETRIEGRKEGKRTWEFFAAEGWTNKQEDTTYLQKVSNGNIYTNGRLSVTRLTAPQVKVLRQAEVIDAMDRVTARIDLGRFSSSPSSSNWANLSADSIRYAPDQKTSDINGNIILKLKDAVIRAKYLKIDHDKKTALFREGVAIDRGEIKITADSAEYLAGPEQLRAEGNVLIVIREKALATEIRCGQAVFFLDKSKDVTMAGNVEARQKGKLTVAETGTYSKRSQSLTLKGYTRTVLEKAGTLLRESTAKKLRSEGSKELLKEKTVVTAAEMYFSTRSGNAGASGGVLVTQKGKEARSGTALYDDINELLTLRENVSMKEKDEWIDCRELIVSIREEDFKALGVSRAKIKI